MHPRKYKEGSLSESLGSRAIKLNEKKINNMERKVLASFINLSCVILNFKNFYFAKMSYLLTLLMYPFHKTFLLQQKM